MDIDQHITDLDTAPDWDPALENELGRLAQGFKQQVTAQDAMEFILFDELPTGRKSIHVNFICDYCPLKAEKIE